MKAQDTVAVIGAGVIGVAVAYALAREGISVHLLDRSEPGVAGASFGNAGHIAAELVEPLPSWSLLFGFWRELFAVGGPLDIPLTRVPRLLPWARHFAAAGARRSGNTQHLAPLVRPALVEVARWLAEVGRPELLKENGHFEVWFGPAAQNRAVAQASAMQRLGIPTQTAPTELLRSIAQSKGGSTSIEVVAGLWFPGTGHVIDPLEVVRAIASAALQRGTVFTRTAVQAVEARPDGAVVYTATGALEVRSVVVCAGAWSARLLTPFGLSVPLEAARGYHVELSGLDPLVQSPILYADRRVLVTPMRGRLRASSFMEFADPDAELDSRKPARLRADLRNLGYFCPQEGPSWVGSRPVLPDYLPGIGRIERTNIFYAIGHQHIGLTLAPVTGDLIADLIAGRPPRLSISAFDLRRFSRRARPP